MCRYRYYYFGTCQHHETVLFDFCEHALPQQDACFTSAAPAAGTKGNENARGSCKAVGSGMGEDREGASAEDNTDLPSLSSTTLTSPSSSINSALGTGSAYIIAEPCVDCSSLPAAHSSHPSSPSASSPDMAGLPRFGGTFRRWMDCGTAITPEQDTARGKDHMFMSSKSSMEAFQGRISNTERPYPRSRQSGIRERTDESCDLPRSNDIMQHLAEICHGGNVHNVGTDGQRMTSYGSTVTIRNFQSGEEATQNTYDSIEAEIDQLKEDIVRLREEADHVRSSPKTEQELASDRFLSTRSGRWQALAVDAAPESAAARLQKQHEANIGDHSTIAQQQRKVQEPPSPLDFPALEHRKQTSGAPTAELQSQQRKPSYADAITKGMIRANDQAFSAAMAKRKDSKISDSTSEGPISTGSMLSSTQTCSTLATQDSCEDREDEEYSVIISPRSIETNSSSNDPIIVSRGQQSAKNGKPTKQAPRFAQPTQSFSRRTGETVRTVLSQVSPKVSPAASPTKSVKAKEPNLATNKRAAQRQQKRKSLPDTWVGDDSQKLGHTGCDVIAKTGKGLTTTLGETSSTFSSTSPSSAKGGQVVKARSTKENVTRVRAKAKGTQAYSTVHQKKKTHMSATNAVKQRAVVTLEADKTNRGPPKDESAVPRSPAAHETRTPAKLQRSSTLSSEASSVHFILDHTHPMTSPMLRQISNDAQGQSVKIHHNRTEGVSLGLPSASTTASPCKSGHTLASKLPIPATHAESGTQQHSPQSSDPCSTGNSILHYLPAVANTTAKRRTSNGHLLKPIFACLDAKGLLNKTPTNNAVVASYLQSMAAEKSGSASKMERDKISVSVNSIPERSFHSSHQITADSPVKKTLALHLRKARNASVSINGTLPPESNVAMSWTGQCRDTSTISTLPPAETLPAFDLPQGSRSVEPSSRVSSLRATAHEFRPMNSPSDSIDQIDIHAALSYIHEEQWNRMSPAQRKSVIDLRKKVNSGSAWTTGAVPLQYSPFSAPSNSTGNLSLMTPSPTVAYHHGVNPVDGNVSPNGVQVGDSLIPSVSPAKKTVRWMLRNIDSEETPIKFGRAPPPNLSPSTPTISSTSNDTSPLKTPHSLRQWHIGSTSSSIPYAWTGGDGKEIRFVGYGPHAERDPHSVVDFNFHGRTGSYSASVPNGFGEYKENRPVEARVAPKSQREWAEKIGYQKVPCGNVEIMQAVELCIPFGSQLAGYCRDCMAK